MCSKSIPRTITIQGLTFTAITVAEKHIYQRFISANSECVLISSLPGKVLRTLVDIATLGRAIQHAFSKPSLVNLISKDTNLVFYLSVFPLLKTLRTSDYDVISDVCVDSASLATSFKKCNLIMT